MGNVISKIEDGSPLKHRIRVGDTLLAINGKEIVESAGKKSVQYYEVTFNVLPDGSVQMEE